MPDAPPVEVRALTKRYGSTVAVEDLSFAIPAGRRRRCGKGTDVT